MALVPPDFIRSRLSLPVAILGGGVSGDGVRTLVAALGVESKIYDAKGEPFTADAARRHEVVVYSPGFAQHHPWLELARVAACVCLSELDFASLFWKGKVIAITGTNGKTTLTEFLTHALRWMGIKAHATGNIGFPLSTLVVQEQGGTPATVAICEVSSFQAEDLQHLRPDATLWTNFAEDHLERHSGMAAYFAAKWNLVARTPKGAVFLGSSVQRFAKELKVALPAGSTLATENQPPDEGLAGTAFADYPQRENFLLAAAWWRSCRYGEIALYSAARSFQLARHRLSRVGEFRGATYWNDSKATNFHAVEAALGRFQAPVLLIVGGKSKGGDIPGFVSRIAGRVAHAFLIGETRFALAEACEGAGVAYTVCTSLEQAVHASAERAKRGDNVLLGPAFSSFDMFRNYEDRGLRFEQIVHSLGAAA
jgi:UDP-N-acetylmuramoylalanine--D-glutamate ligase